MGFGLRGVVESVGVGYGHLVDGLFPVGYSCSFNESGCCDSFLFFCSFECSFVFDVGRSLTIGF